MPVYEYECKQCHREFEYQQRMSDPEKTVCENCGGELARIISRTAFQLKGSGWYKDLYGSAKPEGAAGAPDKDKKLAPGIAPPMGAHEGGPTHAEFTGQSVTSDGKSAAEVATAAETAKSKGKPSGGSSSGSTGGTGGGGTDP
ncbi:MAG TPA: zinc ribbon domain-containing protein [Kofleriaceae bacterium]|jgi:putative FmdB family regulatory protein|nr:zinc ribbon domain-containing protein [Kofleriaceae bacterium]